MIEWVLILTIVLGSPMGGRPTSVSIQTQDFTTQESCVYAGIIWKQHVEEGLAKAKVTGKIVVLADCTPKNVTFEQPPSTNPDML